MSEYERVKGRVGGGRSHNTVTTIKRRVKSMRAKTFVIGYNRHNICVHRTQVSGSTGSVRRKRRRQQVT